MADATKGAHNHAEAVVQGHRNAQLISRTKLHITTDKIGVIQNVAVGQGGTLGVSGGAAGELNVDGVVGIELCLDGA